MTDSTSNTVELERFRREWRAEVQRRKALSQAAAAPISSVKSSVAQAGPSSNLIPGIVAATQKHLHERPAPASASTASSQRVHVNATSPSQSLLSALQIYRQAIQHEQQGELDNALVLYRQAFRMDPHVDRAYGREEKLTAILSSQQPVATAATKDLSAEGKTGIDHLAKEFSSVVSLSSARHVSVSGILAHLVSGFPPDIEFEPHDEKQPLWLRTIPEELLVFILRLLDVTSIERFAAVCRKARVLSLDTTLWRELVLATYKPPQVSQSENVTSLIAGFLHNYRRMYIERPRIRLDGVYIAICHYVRPGLSENHWVNISHLVTYHRYLRFFPNGIVLSLLANEEMSPQQVIPLLKPSLRMKGLSLGTWQLIGNTVHLNLIDAGEQLPAALPPSFSPLIPFFDSEFSGSRAHRHPVHGRASSPERRTRYMFVMILDLRSRPLGRWNRLDIESYNSVDLETGDMTPVALKHERPFWFSKVRSYSAS
ncbi:hypothetical protein AX17_004190 [Amanita inopinata Kibby_2008]|nr:hypothetical protein AX17_004190 [Amanita inopinata Kibby_2008]